MKEGGNKIELVYIWKLRMGVCLVFSNVECYYIGFISNI